MRFILDQNVIKISLYITILSEQESEIFHRVWFDIFRQHISHGFGDRTVGFVGIGGGRHPRESLNVCKDLSKKPRVPPNPDLLNLLHKARTDLFSVLPLDGDRTSNCCGDFFHLRHFYIVFNHLPAPRLKRSLIAKGVSCLFACFSFSLADILKSYCWKVFRRHWVHWIARHHYHRISSLVSCHFECLCYACLDAQRYLLTVRHSTEKQKFKSSALECLDSAMYHGHLWTSMDIYGHLWTSMDRGSHHHVIDVPVRPGELGLFLCRHLHGALPAGRPKLCS